MEHPISSGSSGDFEKLGMHRECYVKKLTAAKARELFPSIAQSLKNLPDQQVLFSAHHADGTPFAVSDREDHAIGQGVGKDMNVWRLH